MKAICALKANALLGLLLCVAVTAASAASGQLHPFQATQPPQAPSEVLMVVEIPAGSMVKYEIGEDGLVYVDRFQSMPVVYPGNYGALPRTLAGDGDTLDALVLTREPLHPGVLIRIRPIGVLRMLDGDEADEKIIGVPADDVDPSYVAIRDIADLPRMESARIEAFFRVYKDLPAGRKQVVLDGYGDAGEARALIRQALQLYDNRGHAQPR